MYRDLRLPPGAESTNAESQYSLFIDYRHFDAENIEPRFEFGFGMFRALMGFLYRTAAASALAGLSLSAESQDSNSPLSSSVPDSEVVGEEGGKKKGKRGEDEDDDADLAVVVDGDEDRRQDTDVSAFVDALRKRGFILSQDGGDGYPAVDMGNKMFVKMRFVKAATPGKGKGAVAAAADGRRAPKKKWIDAGEDEDEGVDEAEILKPCVYKIR